MAFVMLWQPGKDSKWTVHQRYTLAGVLAGLALLCDYSGVIPLFLLGIYALIKRTESASLKQSARDTFWYLLGSAGPVAVLWFYQWRCFGNPFYPPQHYMPAQNQYVESGYKGFGWFDPEIFRMLLFDIRFGLFVVSPMLLLGLGALLFRRSRKSLIPSREILFILVYFLAFVLFFSAVQYARLQWITGFRYLAPVIPFLFLPTVAVMCLLPRLLTYGLGVTAIVFSWCLAMVRSQQGPAASIAAVFADGLQLPWLNTLSKMPQYTTFLSNGIFALPLFLFTVLILYAIWRVRP